MSRPSTILISPGGWEQAPLIARAAETFDRVVVCDGSASPSGLVPGVEHHRLDSTDLLGFRRLAEELEPDAVLGDQCDYSGYLAAALAEERGLPGTPLAAAYLGVDKAAAREVFAAAGVPQPAYRLTTSLAEARAAAAEIGYPVVCKPPDNRGCFGVQVACSARDLPGCFYEALENSRYRRVLIEEHVAGRQLTVDGYHFGEAGHRVLAVGLNDIQPGRRPINQGIHYPAPLEPGELASLLDVHARAVAATGGRFGPTHAEYRLDSSGTPRLLELAHRGGGVLIFPLLVAAVTGLDMVERLLADAAGEPPEGPPPDHLPTAGTTGVLDFFDFEVRGTLRDLGGLEEARAAEGVLAVQPILTLGAPILPAVNGAKRHAFTITTGADVDEALARAAAARAHLSIEVDP